MMFKDKTIEILDINLYAKGSFHIENCIIRKIMMSGCTFQDEVIINNSIIHEVDSMGTWFERGLVIRNCVFKDRVSFESSGHNKNGEIVIDSNIFMKFVDFFDAHFEALFVFKNNIVFEGTNLLGNGAKPIAARFGSATEIIDNVGDISVNDDENT